MVVLRASVPNRRVQVIARWARALMPAAVLVVTPTDLAQVEVSDQDAITLDAKDVASGPLALADAIAKAAAEHQRRG